MYFVCIETRENFLMKKIELLIGLYNKYNNRKSILKAFDDRFEECNYYLGHPMPSGTWRFA